MLLMLAFCRYGVLRDSLCTSGMAKAAPTDVDHDRQLGNYVRSAVGVMLRLAYRLALQ